MSKKIEISRRSVIAGAGAVAASVPLIGRGYAQEFPTRPIRWICYQAPGGSMDLTMRAYQPFLAERGVETQLDYVQGGSGNIARTQVYTAEPDGYTMMLEAAPAPVLGQVVAGAAYEALKFEPIFGWSVEGWHIATRKDGDIKTLDDLLAVAKTRPISAASIGRGSSTHLQLLVIAETLGIDMNIVHFNGSAQAYPQAIGGNVDIAMGGPGSGSRARDRLQILAVTRDIGEPALPDVPTFQSLGYDVPEINQTWYASTTPGVPADRLEKLTSAFADAFEDPDFKAAQAQAGFEALQKLMPADIRKINEDSFALAEKYKAALSAE